MGGDGRDFFVSHAGADRAWAEWAAWQLKAAGYRVVLDVWDWAAGQNFVTAMSDALDRCDRVVALFSQAYFDRSRYTTEEWSSSVLHLGGAEARLIPVRIEDVPDKLVPSVLRPLVYRDVFGLDQAAARRALLEAVRGPAPPDAEPWFPGVPAASGAGVARDAGAAEPRLPGTAPGVWNVPPRNRGFTGRDGLLVAMRERLIAGDQVAVQALQGMSGVGKTQLAIEYAHRFASTYDLVWWVDTEQAALIGAQFAALGLALGCVAPRAEIDVVRPAVLAALRARARWLLVFDNAQQPADLVPWLPDGPAGHVLITSRPGDWRELAGEALRVEVFTRAESLAVLQDRLPGLAGPEAGPGRGGAGAAAAGAGRGPPRHPDLSGESRCLPAGAGPVPGGATGG